LAWTIFIGIMMADLAQLRINPNNFMEYTSKLEVNKYG
jgi:hypothetical protein